MANRTVHVDIKVITADPSHAFIISSIGKQSFRDALPGFLTIKKNCLSTWSTRTTRTRFQKASKGRIMFSFWPLLTTFR